MEKFTNQLWRKPKFKLKTFFRQIQHVILICMPATQDLQLDSPETIILMSIKNCPVEHHNDLDMHYYCNVDGYTELVDITAIQCLVG